jgi:hypothetical protein
MSTNVAYQADEVVRCPHGGTRRSVEPVGRHLGAEIHGLDLKNGMDADTFARSRPR